MNKLVVRRAAQLDVRSIREWFEGNEVGLGDRFLAELDDVVGRVRMAPAQFPEIGRSLRRALLRRFPYSIENARHSPDRSRARVDIMSTSGMAST